MRARVLVALTALTMALAGAFLLLRAGDGLSVHDTVVEGIPMTEVHSSEVNGSGVVVAHGFAGSGRLMTPFADTLARRGFLVVLFDFARHGRNSSTSGGNELEVAVRHLRSLPGIDPARISLVGHSMGAGAVTRYAASHSDIAHTVAISLGSLESVPPRMLLIAGGLEFPRFREVAAAARDTGRHRVVIVPRVEHISVLFAPRTHEEILSWLDAPPGPAPQPWLGLLAGGLLLIAFAIGIYPLTALLPRPAGPPLDSPPPSLMLAAPVAAVAAVALAALLPELGVGAYVGIFVALTGALTLLWARVRGHLPRLGRLSLSSLIFIGYPIIAIAVPIHFGLTHALPSGPRWLLLPAMVAAFALLGLGTIALTGGRQWRALAVFACAAVVLTLAAVLGVAPGFILLIVPLVVLLLGWQAIWTATLARAGAPVWLIAVACAILPAWPTATAMPL